MGPEFAALVQRMKRLAMEGRSVLVYGPTGCGKELLLRAYRSVVSTPKRHCEIINCGAFPETLLDSELFGYVQGAFTGAVKDKPGLIETCDYIALDELGAASAGFQVRLLRALEHGEYRRVGDVRAREKAVTFIAATNDVYALRRDLVWRFDAWIEVPRLAYRRRDLLALIDHLAREANVGALTERCLHFLLAYPWPGNARELRHVLWEAARRAAGAPVDVQDLPMREVLAHQWKAQPRGKDVVLDERFVQRATARGIVDVGTEVTEALQRAHYERLATPERHVPEAYFRQQVLNHVFSVAHALEGIEARMAASFAETAASAATWQEAATAAKRAWFEARNGTSTGTLAKELGTSPQAVREHRRKLQLPRQSRRGTTPPRGE